MLAIVLSLFYAITASWAQQLDGYYTPFDSLGLGTDCLAAVNTTVSSCPAWLRAITGLDPSVTLVPETDLSTLCDSTCRSDLAGLLSTIESACTASTDVMVPDGVTAYPATFMAERYIYATDISCLKDTSSGDYCNVLVTSWLNETNNNVSAFTSAQNCSYCELAVLQYQLASPIGYDDDTADTFSSLTASCAEATYTYSVPATTTWALNATAIPTSRPACNGTSYALQANDTCVTISGAQGVSTYGLITANALTLACDSLPDVGTDLCLSGNCTTYQLQGNDTCSSIVDSLGITLAQLLTWNPNINAGCSNLASYRGWYLCVGSPSKTVTVPLGSAATTAAPVPTNAQPQSNTDCGQWYFVLPNDDCSLISVKFGISLSDFYFLNPQVDSACDNLWANTSYCVAAVGNIQTYTSYPTSTATSSFTRPATSSAPIPTYTGQALYPTAPGTIEGCYQYLNAYNTTANTTADDAVANVNSCSAWVWSADVALSDLLAWNPSLDASNCVLQSGYSYCVQKDETQANITYPYDYCFAPNSSLINAASVQPADCACYIQLRAADETAFNCSQFPSLFNITVETAVTLNTQLGNSSACDSNLWTGLVGGYEQLCVERNTTSGGGSGSGGGGSLTSSISTSSASSLPPTATSSLPTATSSTPPLPTSSVVPPAETEPGTTTACTKYHVVVSGDTCYDLSVTYNITLDDFYSWNPNVGTDCSGLWLGYAVCVGV